MKNLLISFDDDTESILLSILMFLQVVSTYICNGCPKSKSILGFGGAGKPCFESSHRSNIKR